MKGALLKVLVEVLRFAWPGCNKRTREIVGTVFAVLATVVAVVGPLVIETPQEAPAIEAPAPVDGPGVPVDVDAVEPDDAGIFDDAVTMFLGGVSSVLGMSCSGAQQQAWAGVGVGALECSSRCGIEALGGAIIGTEGKVIGKDALDCFLRCLASSGLSAVTTFAGYVLDPTGPQEGYFGSATESPRHLPEYRVQIVQ